MAILVEVLRDIPADFEEKEVESILAAGRLKDKMSDIAGLIVKSRPLIEPRAVYAFDNVSRIDGDNIHLRSEHTLRSIILADTLQPGQEIALYVVTIGRKLEEEASELSKANLFGALTLERIGDIAVQKAAAYLRSKIQQRMGRSISNFGPGTGTGKLFSINQQEVLFEILDPLRNIEVRLTPSYLMIPRKSISGVLAASNAEYVACEYCPRKCEFRRKQFSGEYRPVKCNTG